MTIHFCKSLISLSFRNSSHLYKMNASSSFCVIFFSSSPGENKPSDISVADYLVHEHHFSHETALKVSSSLSYLKYPERADTILSFFRKSGFSQTQLENIVEKLPDVLSADPNKTIKPKIKIFLDWGFSSSIVAEIISHDPWILRRGMHNQLASISLLKSTLGSNLGLFRVLTTSCWFLKHDLEKSMMPNINYLKSIGISSSQITQLIYNFPRFFLHKPETMKGFVNRVDKMGFDRNSRLFLHAIRVVSSMSVENWKLKLKLFQTLGFSEDDILAAFQKTPQVFAVSKKKIKEITQLVLSTGLCNISYFIDHPQLLIFSVEKRIKPRLQILVVLKENNLIKRIPSLLTFLRHKDAKFFEKYVHPYPNEVGNLFVYNQGS